MNKEQLLAVISKVIDMGGRVSIFSGQYDKSTAFPWKEITENDAEELVSRFRAALGGGDIKRADNDAVQGVSSFTIDSEQIRGDFSFRNNFMEEDVDLTGGDEHATA